MNLNIKNNVRTKKSLKYQKCNENSTIEYLYPIPNKLFSFFLVARGKLTKLSNTFLTVGG